ncbi:hypothetical protein [Spirulina sp. 06S082]|uniref:hypothetical protein n=1 Tax=Spirulina sp. 06S082 TaxID=3110248 RepID=UPI002B21F1FF|nr:hypothetical protein [Spirulina sp. 06S082]MEA5467898.1 hypothetical protein [Spirulina sp. 06S082]
MQQQSDLSIFSAFILALSQCDRDREATLRPQLNAIAELLPEKVEEAAKQLLTFLVADESLYPIYKTFRYSLQELYKANSQKACISPKINQNQNDPIPLENHNLNPGDWQKVSKFYALQKDESSRWNLLAAIKKIFSSYQPIAESQREFAKLKDAP